MLAPGLHPSTHNRPTSSHAERRVFEALQAYLPKGWYAWHSLRVDTGWTESEGDFVVLDPTRGMLLVEVKGGVVEERDGLWYQNGRPMDTDPREQAQQYARRLASRMHATGAPMPPFAVVSWLPDVPVCEQPLQDDLRGKVLGQNHLAWCAEALSDCMATALGARAAPVEARSVDALHALWGETWTPRLSLGQRARLDDADRVQLDATQLRLMHELAENQRLLVSGAVGTGKTLMACAAARRLAEEGLTVLLLCFTDGLAQWLAAHVNHPGVLARPVSRLATELLQRAGRPVPLPRSQDEWDEAALAAGEIADRGDQSWDAVVIDEAQDFTTSHWLLVSALAGGRRLWAFQDPNQAYWRDRQVDRRLFTSYLNLSHFYRCPPELMRVAEAMRTGESDDNGVRAAVAAGRFCTVSCPSASAVAQRVATEVTKLRGQGLEPGQLAVISLRGLSAADSVLHSTALSPHQPVRVEDPEFATSVVADTFLRFKGLERPGVIVTDLGLVTRDLGLRMYIALTRAQTTARVVATRQVLERHPVLACTA